MLSQRYCDVQDMVVQEWITYSQFLVPHNVAQTSTNISIGDLRTWWRSNISLFQAFHKMKVSLLKCVQVPIFFFMQRPSITSITSAISAYLLSSRIWCFTSDMPERKNHQFCIMGWAYPASLHTEAWCEVQKCLHRWCNSKSWNRFMLTLPS